MSRKILTATHLDRLAETGAVLFRNLPITRHWDEYVRPLGRPIESNKTGSPIRAIKPNAAFAQRSYSLSCNELNPHTEAPYLDPPPRYLALWGVQPARCGGGQTSFADGYAMVASFSKETQCQLKQNTCRFPRVNVQGSPTDSQLRAPILEKKPNSPPILRFSYNLFCYADYNTEFTARIEYKQDMSTLAKTSAAYYQQNSTNLTLGRGDLLILDNHRMVHARRAFQDANRRLEVVWLD